jgi:uncharacterized membrane protein
MLIAVALLALGFSLGKLPLGHAGLMLIVLVLLIGAHIVGNALGMYLRDQSPLHRQQEPLPFHAQPLQREPRRFTDHEPTQLQQRTEQSRWVLIAIIAGVLGGGIGGARLFWSWYEQTFAGWLLGTISSAVIGGILSFIVSSFLVMAYRAWTEATRGDSREEDWRVKKE